MEEKVDPYAQQFLVARLEPYGSPPSRDLQDTHQRERAAEPTRLNSSLHPYSECPPPSLRGRSKVGGEDKPVKTFPLQLELSVDGEESIAGEFTS